MGDISEDRVKALTAELLAATSSASGFTRLETIKSLVGEVSRPEVSGAFEAFVASDGKATLKLAMIRKLNSAPSPACARIGILGLEMNQNGNVRVAAADLLGKLDDEESLSALRKGLQDDEDAVVTHCARSLGLRADSASEPELLALLGRSRRTVRLAAAKALAESGSESSLEPLQQLAKSERWPFKLLAKDAAKRLSDRIQIDSA